MTYVGIDVSKDTFTVAYSSDKNSKTKPSQRKIHTVCLKQQETTVRC